MYTNMNICKETPQTGTSVCPLPLNDIDIMIKLQMKKNDMVSRLIQPTRVSQHGIKVNPRTTNISVHHVINISERVGIF